MSDVPAFSQIMKNVVDTLPSIYTMLAAVFMLFALITTCAALMDFVQASDKHKKYLGAGPQPTIWSGLIKLVIAGVMANFASNGQIVQVISSIFFDDQTFALVSLSSYVPQSNETELQKYIRITIIGFTQIAGLVAIFKGLRIWAKIADKSGRDSFWHGANFIFFGTLCIQFAKVLGVIQATLGFDFFSMIGVA